MASSHRREQGDIVSKEFDEHGSLSTKRMFARDIELSVLPCAAPNGDPRWHQSPGHRRWLPRWLTQPCAMRGHHGSGAAELIHHIHHRATSAPKLTGREWPSRELDTLHGLRGRVGAVGGGDGGRGAHRIDFLSIRWFSRNISCGVFFRPKSHSMFVCCDGRVGRARTG